MNEDNEEVKKELVQTYWLERGSEQLANAVHDFNRFAASGYEAVKLRNQYLKICELITNVKARADEIKVHVQAELYCAMVDDEM